MTYDVDMMKAYLNWNRAKYYIFFATRPNTRELNAYVIPKETVAKIPEVAPNLFDGGTDGVPRVKLLQIMTFEPAIRKAGGWHFKQELNVKYEDITVGKNGTRSAALEQLSKQVAQSFDRMAKSVKNVGNLPNTADLRVERFDGTVYFIEVKCRQGRFNVNNGNFEYTKGNEDYRYKVIWDNGSKSKMVKEQSLEIIIDFLHMELYEDSDITIIDLKQKEEQDD